MTVHPNTMGTGTGNPSRSSYGGSGNPQPQQYPSNWGSTPYGTWPSQNWGSWSPSPFPYGFSSGWQNQGQGQGHGLGQPWGSSSPMMHHGSNDRLSSPGIYNNPYPTFHQPSMGGGYHQQGQSWYQPQWQGNWQGGGNQYGFNNFGYGHNQNPSFPQNPSFHPNYSPNYFGSGFSGMGGAQGFQNSNCINLCETAEEFIVTCEIPGVDEKDCEVCFQNGCLMIRGDKRPTEEEGKGASQFNERCYGRFCRYVTLGDMATMIDEAKITAKCNNRGVLCITLPKRKQSSANFCRVPVSNK